MTPLETLIKELKIIADLQGASSLLQWDQETYMPEGGGASRADQIALLDSLRHERLVGPVVRGALGELVDLESGQPDAQLTAEQERLVREIWSNYHRAAALPKEFVEEYSQTTSMAQQVWAQARKANDFGKFQPFLEKIVDLKFREIDYLGVKTTPYDTLLDYFEPGMTSAEVTRLFEAVKVRLVPLVRKIAES
ncbi:MAG: carboxypeptidase M32, partial [Candidatus Neomarinimicrobiota bacterium]